MNPRLLRPRASSAVVAVDADARTYINAVRIADGGQYMEVGVQQAIDAFVTGCKSDGIWSAIQASCILAGARTLAGALVPLKGSAPTNNNFVSGDYNRKTGLVGNGNNKFIDTNRSSDAQSQNSIHVAVYASSLNTGTNYYCGDALGTGQTNFFVLSGASIYPYCRENTGGGPLSSRHAVGLMGLSRSASGSYTFRGNGQNSTISVTSNAPPASDFLIFAGSPGASFVANARLAFYSIGDALTLATLETRVASLITAIGAAI
jgi:hypothetical protein